VVQVLDTTSGRVLARWESDGRIKNLAYSPDGRISWLRRNGRNETVDR
jgi:hypothetical protein